MDRLGSGFNCRESYVVNGSLMLHSQGEDHSLGAGDSVYFDSAEPHSYRGLTEPSARAVVVTLPPRS
jgi:quercetin dioxygenase-like cupin family protein